MRGAFGALIEREHELSVLTRLSEEAASGEGRLAILLGEAGIGKTALLVHAGERAAAAGLRLLTARGAELEHGFPFGVVRQLLEPLLAARSAADRKELLSGAASLAAPVFAPGATAVMRSDPDFSALHGLYWLLANLAGEQPVAIMVDDLQWCDTPSLRFLAFALRRLSGLPVLIAAAARPGDRSPADPLVEEFVDDPTAVVLRPGRLSDPGVTELVAARLGPASDARLAAACHTATGGNPFYLSALIDDLATLPRPAPTDISARGPDAVARSASRRLDRLGPEARALVEAIMVLGDGVESDLVGALAGLGPNEVAAAGRALAEAAILAEPPGLGFAHPIVHAALRARVDGPALRRRHAEAARLLIAWQADDDAVAVQLLEAAAGAVPEATERLRAAAARASAAGASDSAVSFLARALEEPLDGPERVEILIALGLAEAKAGRPAALVHLEEARQSATDPQHRATAALVLAQTLFAAGSPQESVELLERETTALSAHAPEQAAAVESELLSIADLDLSVRPLVSERLVAIKPLDAVAADLPAAMRAHLAVARLVAGEDGARAADHAFAALADGSLQARALLGDQLFFITVFVLTGADAFDNAEEQLSAILAEAQVRGSAITFSVATAQRAFLRFRRGDLAGAEADARAALDTAGLNRWLPIAQMALKPLIDVMIERGEPALAWEAAAAAGIALDDPGETTQGNVLLEARGRLRIATGDVNAGTTDLLAAGARFRDWGMINPGPFAWRSTAALALAHAGGLAQADALVEEELELARGWGAPRTLGVALLAASRLARDGDRAELLREAVTTLRPSGARLVLARTLTDLGASLRRANRRADAREPLREALELAVACGAQPLAQEARTELWATGARPRLPVRTGLDALTASERRVAEMAASGRSNPQIAQDLFVTVKTVEMHLSNAYRKLDITNRSELTAVLSPIRD